MQINAQSSNGTRWKGLLCHQDIRSNIFQQNIHEVKISELVHQVSIWSDIKQKLREEGRQYGEACSRFVPPHPTSLKLEKEGKAWHTLNLLQHFTIPVLKREYFNILTMRFQSSSLCQAIIIGLKKKNVQTSYFRAKSLLQTLQFLSLLAKSSDYNDHLKIVKFWTYASRNSWHNIVNWSALFQYN